MYIIKKEGSSIKQKLFNLSLQKLYMFFSDLITT